MFGSRYVVPPIVCYCIASILMTVVNKVCLHSFLLFSVNEIGLCSSSYPGVTSI